MNRTSNRKTRSVLPLLMLLGMPSTLRADIPPVAPSPSSKPTDGDLIVSVQGLQAQTGSVVALLFPSDQGFPAKQDQAAQRQTVKVTAPSVELHFAHVASGTYAVTVYHDVNDNGKLDTNWIGIPKEPVGVSNNPKPRMGPPRWKDASFTMTEPPYKVVVNLVRP